MKYVNARAAYIMIQRNCVEVAQEAIKVCGGRALLKQFPLERFLRDAGLFGDVAVREIATEAVWEKRHSDGEAA